MENKHEDWIEVYFIPALILLAVFLAWFIPEAKAEDHSHGHMQSHAKLHSWYLTLKSPRTGYSCCHSLDCRAAPEAKFENGHWSVVVNGSRVSVPPDLVIKPDSTENPTVEAHVCHYAHGHDVLCFVPPNGGT